jgi:ketosteroid isomerase-like protein
MKVLIKAILVLVGCVSLDPVLAQPPRTPLDDASVAGTIRQLARDWGDAEIASDVDRLSQIIADDWVTGYPGHMYTKASHLSDVRSGKHKLLTCEYGPHEVKVIGDVAVVQGTVTETRAGYDGIFHVAYTDVWVKRGNKWMVVRSLAKSKKD